MKYTVLLLTCAFSVSHAEDRAATVEEFCASIGDVAYAVMSARQSGVPLKRVLTVMPKPEDRDLFGLMTHEIALEAYRRPKYESEAIQNKVIDEFSNSMHIDCIDGLRER